MSGRLEFQDGEAPAKNEITRTSVTLRPLDGTFTESRAIRPAADATFTTSGLLPGRYALTTMVMSQGSAWFVKKVTAGGRDRDDDGARHRGQADRGRRRHVDAAGRLGARHGPARRGRRRDARTGTPRAAHGDRRARQLHGLDRSRAAHRPRADVAGRRRRHVPDGPDADRRVPRRRRGRNAGGYRRRHGAPAVAGRAGDTSDGESRRRQHDHARRRAAAHDEDRCAQSSCSSSALTVSAQSIFPGIVPQAPARDATRAAIGTATVSGVS